MLQSDPKPVYKRLCTKKMKKAHKDKIQGFGPDLSGTLPNE